MKSLSIGATVKEQSKLKSKLEKLSHKYTMCCETAFDMQAWISALTDLGAVKEDSEIHEQQVDLRGAIPQNLKPLFFPPLERITSDSFEPVATPSLTETFHSFSTLRRILQMRRHYPRFLTRQNFPLTGISQFLSP